METTETYEHKGVTIRIVQDPEPPNPCQEFDTLGRMVCWHRTYLLGHDQPAARPLDWARELLAEYMPDGFRTDDLSCDTVMRLLDRFIICLPVYLLDHSGLRVSVAPFGCPWDSGQVGWIYVTRAKVREEYSVARIGKSTRDVVLGILRAEVQQYDDYLTGNVYGYVLSTPDDECVDSCYGFFGSDLDWVKSEAEAAAEVVAETWNAAQAEVC